jgi:hypothetical protein
VLVSMLNSSDADRVGCFPHSQSVCALFPCSIHLMLTVSDTCFDHRVYVLVSILDSSDADHASMLPTHSLYVLVLILNSSHADRVRHISPSQPVRACFYPQFIRC